MGFRLLWLLLSLLLVPVSAPAYAAITAAFESPPSGPVAGVQVVRGWAFVTEPGDMIARVELVVDGAPAMTIPCCGERADVTAAYPQYPAAVTLHSGWGLTLNWSLLPSGFHTVQVEITTAQGQQWRSEVREVEVVTVGGFEFLDLLSLADATARLEDDEIVLENVRVRDQASGQEREVTLRLLWDPNAQTLSLSGAVTIASLSSLRSTFRGVLTPIWQWLARASGAQEAQAGAGIVSEWESPSADALVSGVQVIRAWMFAEEVGVPIAAVRVVVDGRTATTLPCCSARGDVAAAFPDNPNALESGAALVVNYGNLTAGPHSLGLEIEAANGAMVAFTRDITVLKIGGFDYLDQFDLSQAEVHLEGEEVVLTDVRVREQTSGQEKVLTLRFRWDTATQGFVLAANDPPVASDQRLETAHNHAVGVTLRAQDADGDRLRFEVVDGPAHGQLTGKPPLVYYTPDPGFLGEDRFTFVAQDFASASNVATVTITVTAALTPTNAPPQVDLDPANLSGQQPNFTTTFTEDSGLQAIVSPLMTVIDPDSATLASATATLTNVLDTGQEVLAVDPATVTPNTSIVATYNATTGELRLTGSASLSQYQAALRTLTYTNASQNPNPTDRLIRVVANDGAATSTPVASTVSIRTVNDQPTFTATNPPAIGENAGPQTLTGWATFNPGAPEETGQTVLAYTVSAVSNPGLFTTLPVVAPDGTLTYTPAANTVGTSTFTVTVQDNGGTANGGVDTSAPQTFTITVTAVNKAPTFTRGTDQTVLEDVGAQTVNPWATGMDDGDPGVTQTLTFLITNNTNPTLFSAGPAVDAATGALTYTPAPNANGSAAITLVVRDDGGTANSGQDTSAPQTFTISVTPVNDAPSFTVGLDQTINENAGPQTVNPWAAGISAGPSDEAGQTLTFNITGNTNAALFSSQPVVSPTGVLTYTPAAGASGSAILTLTLSDNGGTANGGVDTSAPQTFTITVTTVDDPPVAMDDTATVNEGDPATSLTVLANDTDLDAGPISIASVTPPANGTVVNNSTDVSYTPNPDYCNTSPGATPDTFTYTLTPGNSTATVSVTVNCVNDVPVVDLDGTADDPGGDIHFATTFTEGTPVGIVDAAALTVSDPDNPNLVSATVTITNLLDAGIETLAATTAGTSITAVYTLATGVLSLTGTDTLANYQQVLRTVMYNNTSQNPNTTARLITFVVNDGTDASAPATTTLSITAVNNPPTVTPATFTLDENSTNGTVVGTVTATDPDLPAQTLSYAITAGNTGNAFAINSSTGQITVATSTALDFETTPTFGLTVQVTDDGTPAQSGSATITVNLNNVNDPPVVTAAILSVAENSANGTAVGTPVTFTDTDVSQTHTFAITAGNTSGAFAINASGQITVANSTALDFETTPTFSLTVQVTDNGTPAQSGSATITVNLTDVNETPTANAQGVTTDEDTPTNLTLTGSDPENAALTFAIGTGPSKGTLSGTAPNLTYTPTANLNGPDSFTFTVNDGTNPSAPATVSITINPVDDPPEAVADTATVTEDAGGTVISVLANDLDIDAGPIGVFSVTQPTNGTVTNNGTNVTYQPDADYCNSLSGTPDTFSYTLSPGGSTALVSVTVTCVNDLPVAQNKSGVTIQANMQRTGIDAGLLTGVTDADAGIDGCTPAFAVASITANSGGTVSNVDLAAGTFDFEPDAGFTGTATVNYTVQDDGCPGSATSAPATISLTVNGPVIWFVDDSAAAGGDGRLGREFQTVGAATTAIGANTNQRIFVFTGSYTQGATLNTDGWLIGQGATNTPTNTFDALMGITPPAGTIARPSIGGVRPTLQNTVTLGTNSNVKGLNITSTTNTGITASGKTGLVTAEVSVTTTTGVAVNLANSGGTVSFTSVSANGAPSGIVLNTTTGSFTVTGDGVNTSVGGNSTGGTIANAIGADGVSAGNGVYLNNTQNVTLRRMTINGTNQNHGIRGISVSGFTLEYSTITGTNGTSTALDEGSVNFDNLLGTAAITNCVIEGGLEDNLNVVNTSGTLNRLTITGSTFGFNNTVNGNNNILIEAQNAGTVLNFTLKSSLIKGARADWINASNNSSSTMDAIIGGPTVADANTFDNLGANAHPGAAAGGNRVVFGAVGPQTVDIRNNTMKGAKGEAIRVRSTAAGALTGTVSARVRNNTIGVQATANSGSSEGSGIFAFGDGGSDMTIAITDNQVFQYNNHGIRLDFGDEINDGSAFNVTVTGNTVNTPGTINTDFNAIHLNNGTVGATDNFTSCVDIGGAGALVNNIVGGGKGSTSPNNQEFRLRQRQSTTVRLPGYGGPNNNDAQVVVYMRGRNTVTPGNGAASNTVPTGGGFIGGAACLLPP